MKAITIWQPWASLIAREIKLIETRSWKTSFCGMIAIHAAARNPPLEIANVGKIIEKYELEGVMPQGKIICIARLYGVLPVENITLSAEERRLGDFSEGRFGFFLDGIKLIKPIRLRGLQRLWNWENGQIDFIERPIKPGEQGRLL